jgi:hypothetical protein
MTKNERYTYFVDYPSIKEPKMNASVRLFRSLIVLLLTGCLLMLALSPALAQEGDGLSLRLSRDFGYSSGTGKIQGTFSMKTSGPDDLARVEYYIDDEKIGEALQEPFALRFSTDDFPLGIHTLYAMGYTSSGRELRSNEIQAQFVSAEEGWQSGMKIALPILVLVFGAMLISYAVTFIGAKRRGSVPLGAKRNYGAAGGAICPRCERPFSRNMLSPNLLVGKLERCPHCGKWSIARAVPLEILRTAEAAELERAKGSAQPAAEREAEKLRKQVDDTRYQDL